MLDLVVAATLGLCAFCRWIALAIASALKSGLGTYALFGRQQVSSVERHISLKLPSSLGVLFNERRIDAESLAFFIAECVSLGVERILVYDPWGVAVAAEDEIRQSLPANINLSVGAAIDGPSATLPHAVLLSADDGRGAIVRACRELSSREFPITSATVAAVLRPSLLDDVSVVLTVGDTPSNAGFPPWPLRVAEFVPVSAVPSNREDVLSSLADFASRDIRLGK